MRFLQRVQKHTPKKAAEDLDRQQEAAAALDPAVVIHRQAAAGNHAVQVRVEVKILPPGVEHGEEAELHTQTRGVAGDGEQSLRGGAKQDIVDHVFVVEGDGRDLLGESEDHVEVLSGQQLLLTLLQPLFARRPLALGAVTISTGAIADVRVLTVVAPFDSTAHDRCSASLDGLHQTMLMQGQRVGLPVSGAVLSKDVGQLQGWRGHQALVFLGRPRLALGLRS